MNKYIIYQGSGGLVHMLGGLVYCCDYINKQKNYLLIVDVKNHKAFLNSFNKYFVLKNIKYSEDYNDIIKVNNYHRINLDYFNNNNVEYNNDGYTHKYNNYYINIGISLEKINYNNNIKMYAGHGGNNHDNIIKYVKCNNDIKNKLKKYKINEKYVGIHFRNTDRSNNINNFINKLKCYKNYKIYIATDDINSLNIFKKELKDYDILYYFEPYNANGKNIHFNDPDKDKIIMSILVDMYMLYNSNIFLDSPNSLVSKLVKKMRLYKESIFD
jgi:hypothetical protein